MHPGAVALAASIEGIRIYLANAAVFLIIGGLAVLFLIVTLFLLQGLLPISGDATLPAGKGNRRLRPLFATEGPVVAAPVLVPGGFFSRRPAFLKRRPEEATPVPRIDTTLDRFTMEALGEPRILRRTQNMFLLRVLNCKECANPATAPATLDVAGCEQVRGRLQLHARTVFGTIVRVQERACRARGHPACDFEVVP